MCFAVNGSVCLVCCVFVNCFGVVAILLLNVIEVFCVAGGVVVVVYPLP